MTKNMNKSIDNSKKHATGKSSNIKMLAAALSLLLLISFVSYFAFSCFLKPREKNIHSSDKAEVLSGNAAENASEELTESPAEVEESAGDYRSYFLTSEMSAALIIDDEKGLYDRDLKIIKNSNGSVFTISETLDAGSRIKFGIVISMGQEFKSEDYQAVVRFDGGLEKIKMLEDKDGILYDPFSKNIIIKKEVFNSPKDIILEFSATVQKDAENGQELKLSISINRRNKQVFQSSINGRINAVADFSRSSMSVRDLNGGDLWAKEIINYEVKIINSGKGRSRELIVKCPVPAGTGLADGSVQPGDFILSKDKSFISWSIGMLKPGEVKVLSYRVFTADYLTYRTAVKSGFTVMEKNTEKELFKADAPEIFTEQYSYQTIVCMGDSQIVVTEWPLILDGLLEMQYPHAEFDTILSGIRGEMAINAISRFDNDIRPCKPDIIILGYGCNDAGSPPAFFKYHMGILIQQALSTGAKVFVHGIGYIDTANHLWSEKSNYTLFNEMLKKEICPAYGVEYIDIYPSFQKDPAKFMRKDGMHWSKEGADLVAHEVFKKIVQSLDSNGNIKD
ncbi:MAG: GDSL-like Lipase/Acylhydrolase [Actinobacteria bacterium ADurb.Bin346]|nr:MAG: GDSL-like Lipase/Acylhydrolase [Actinobacteria bacterium ADurb.Bin346]